MLLVFVELVGHAQEVGVGVAFEYVHPEQGGPGHLRLERIVVRDLVRY